MVFTELLWGVNTWSVCWQFHPVCCCCCCWCCCCCCCCSCRCRRRRCFCWYLRWWSKQHNSSAWRVPSSCRRSSMALVLVRDAVGRVHYDGDFMWLLWCSSRSCCLCGCSLCRRWFWRQCCCWWCMVSTKRFFWLMRRVFSVQLQHFFWLAWRPRWLRLAVATSIGGDNQIEVVAVPVGEGQVPSSTIAICIGVACRGVSSAFLDQHIYWTV